MKSTYQKFALCVGVVALSACSSTSTYDDRLNSSAAQTQDPVAARSGATAADYAAHTRDVRASQLIGQQVTGKGGELLGKVVDLIVDPRYERVHYAVLQFDSAQSMGDRYFAYPLSSFHIDSSRNSVQLHLDRETLSRSPAFERIEWPLASAQRIGEYAMLVNKAHDPSRTIVNGPELLRASDLIGKDIDDRAGAQAGEIRDLVVDAGTGHVRYVVADLHRPFLPQAASLPLPLDTLSFAPAGEGDAVISLDQQRLSGLRGYDPNRWPDLNDPSYRQQVDEQLDRLSRPAQSR